MPTIRLIAPSGYPHDAQAMQRGVKRLRAAGCTVDGLSVLERRHGRFAGADAERAADLAALAEPPAPDIALAIRGGYGATRLLERLDLSALGRRLAEVGTLLVGHSDFTALQLALYARSGLVTYAGPMLGADFGAQSLSPFTWTHFWAVISQPEVALAWPTRADTPPVRTEGTLWGGNLAMLCSLLGTDYFPRIDGGLLFVEDVGEPPYRVERLLYQLHLSGVLRRQRALLIGRFSNCRPTPYDAGYDLDAVIGQLRRICGVPVVEGLPFGHEADKFTLPFGTPAWLVVEDGTARLGFAGHPRLASPWRPEPVGIVAARC